MNLKKIFAAVTVMLMVGIPAYAAEIPPDVRINGEFTEPVSYIRDGRTYVPVRTVSEKLGYTVRWDGKNIIIDDSLTVNDFELKGDTAYVPLRFVSESLGADVIWDSELHIADVKTRESNTDDSLYWLSRIISAESEGEPLEGRVAVGNVVLNRVVSDEYPDTVKDVVFDRKHGVQFTPVADGRIYNRPTRGAVQAAKLAMRGERPVGNSLFFMNPKTASCSWIAKNRILFARINNHNFYL